MSKRTKNILLLVIIVLAIILAVIIAKGQGSTPTVQTTNSGLSSSTGDIPLPGAPVTSQSGNDEFSTLLSSINRITINTALFQNPAYILLRDHPVVLGTDLVGRVNPFAPIGSDGPIGVPDNALISVQTLQPAKITSVSAELGAQVSNQGATPVSIIFEYGTSDLLGSATAPLVVPKSGSVLTTISRLIPDTTYYVRAVAVRGTETTTAQTMTFITSKAAAKR